MSQEKVNRYKQEKSNRRQTLKRAKIKKNILTVLGTMACVAIVGWIGYSGYNYFQSKNEKNPTSTEIDLSAVTDYMNDLYPEADAE